MPVKRDYYEVLGLSRDASTEEVRKSFRRLARQHHPDVNPDDPNASERFKEINEAHEVLADPARRRRYDTFGHAGAEGGGGFGPDFAPGGVGDIFDLFFGGGQRAAAGPQPGADLRYDLQLTLEEAARGVEKTLQINRLERCERCQGVGAEPGTRPTACMQCGGAGQVRSTQSTFLGAFATVTTCPRCHGRGQVVPNPCTGCGGRGRLRQRTELKFQVEAGADSDMRVRVRGAGEHGEAGAPPGDLYIFFHVRPHRVFRRRGRDLECTLPTPMTVAALGGTLPTPTLDGPVDVDIPPGTQPGDVFRVRGKGVPEYGRANPGDLLVVCHVIVPKRLKPEQREALERFAALRGELESTQRASAPGLFERVRNVFHGPDSHEGDEDRDEAVADEVGAER